MNLALTVFIIIFVLTFLLRIPIPFGFITGGVFYMALKGIDTALAMEKVLTGLYSNYILIAIPLFIFTAKLMNEGKITEHIFKFANGLVGRFHGGLGHVNVVASIIFSGMTGSALADASGLGIMEIEEMRKAGYDDGFSCAITQASATIGPIFPPSIPMILFSMLSGASIGRLFLGGMIPGLLIGAALMLYIAFISKKRGYPKGAIYTFRTFMRISIIALPSLFTPVILLGGIYTGIMTPTEAGAVAGFYAILISVLVYRNLGIKKFIEVLIDSVKALGSISLLVGSTYVVVFVIANEQIAVTAAGWITQFANNKYIFLLFANFIFLFLGMFLNIETLLLIFIPIVLPITQTLGIDITHFGVVIVMNMMIGLSSPPYGAMLFVTSGISGVPMHVIIKDLIPMLFVLITVLLLITYFPNLVLFLPNLLMPQ